MAWEREWEGMGMNVSEWDGNGNIMTKFTGMGIKSWEWEGMGTEMLFPHTSSLKYGF